MNRKRKKQDFDTQIGRITTSAVAIYTEQAWLSPFAQRLGIGRSTLYRYLGGARGIRNVDQDILRVLAEERQASFARANRIAGVERRMANFLAREAAAKARRASS